MCCGFGSKAYRQEIVADRPGEYTICWSAVPSVSLGRIMCYCILRQQLLDMRRSNFTSGDFSWSSPKEPDGFRSICWSAHCSGAPTLRSFRPQHGYSSRRPQVQRCTGPRALIIVLLVTRPLRTVNRQIMA